MTKQEEIKCWSYNGELIVTWADVMLVYPDFGEVIVTKGEIRERIAVIKQGFDKLVRENAKSDTIWGYLDINGVVIKREENPSYPGWFRVEPLIKEKENE